MSKTIKNLKELREQKTKLTNANRKITRSVSEVVLKKILAHKELDSNAAKISSELLAGLSPRIVKNTKYPRTYGRVLELAIPFLVAALEQKFIKKSKK